MTFYLSMEEVLLSFLPNSRRSNKYCMLMRSYFHISEIQQVNNLEQLEKLWYRVSKRMDLMHRKSGKYDDTRYMGINLHSFFKDGHVEIRYHSGTTNARKILEWVNLHQTILDKASEEVLVHGRYRASSSIGSQAAKAMENPNLAEKTQLFFDILNLPASSRAYFLDRQAIFSKAADEKGEGASMDEVCAE
jgi:hypothetical protein